MWMSDWSFMCNKDIGLETFEDFNILGENRTSVFSWQPTPPKITFSTLGNEILLGCVFGLFWGIPDLASKIPPSPAILNHQFQRPGHEGSVQGRRTSGHYIELHLCHGYHGWTRCPSAVGWTWRFARTIVTGTGLPAWSPQYGVRLYREQRRRPGPLWACRAWTPFLIFPCIPEHCPALHGNPVSAVPGAGSPPQLPLAFRRVLHGF